MDRLESLGNALSQITMYDIKSMYNQVCWVVVLSSEVAHIWDGPGQERRTQRQ